MLDNLLQKNLREALRLTRAGQLRKATAAIQHALAGGAPAPTAARVFDGEFERIGNPRPHAPGRRQNAPPGARFVALSYDAAAGGRDYKLYIPSHHQNARSAWPLLVMLHGCTQDPDDFAAGTRMNQLAEDYRCLVAYPAQASSANGSRCWNWFQPGDQQRDRGEPALIAGITRQVMGAYAVDPRRIFIAGLSAGGAMAAVMALNYPELYTAVGVHSGLGCGSANDLPSALAAMRQGSAKLKTLASAAAPALIVFHGDRDATVHSANADQLIRQWRSALGDADREPEINSGQVAGGHAYTCRRQQDQYGKPRLEYWQIHGAGHAWSGGSTAGSYTDPLGPDATRQMLRFFYQQA